MKIAIITVFNSPNFGSCWQARVLYTKLQSLGHEVIMFDTKARSTTQVYKTFFLRSMKALLTGRFKKSSFYFKNMLAFRKNYSALRIESDYNALKKCDAVVFGSDEIWNVKREEMRKFPIFMGKGIDGVRKISYAASINNADFDDLINAGAEEPLRDLNCISVRDSWSALNVGKVCNREIPCVVDPTMLLDKEYYSAFNKNKIEKGYIALYYFDVDESVKKTVKAFAEKTNKKIVSIGYWLDWCDYCVTGENPFTYYIDADYVITNTFHGTAFAINFGKNFVTVPKGKRKIGELLENFGLEDRAVSSDDYEKIVELLQNRSIDWESVNEKMKNQRELSLEFLKTALGDD